MSKDKLSLLEKWQEIIRNNGGISFSGTKPDSALFPVFELKKIYSQLINKAGTDIFQYSSPLGDYSLRKTLSEELLKQQVIVPPEQIIVTAGAQMALDLLVKALLPPRGAVFVEEPSFVGIQPLFDLKKASLAAFPLDEEGIKTENIERHLARHRKPNLLYLVTDFQNPTGISLSLERRKQIARLAKKYDFFVIEDRVYSPLFFDAQRESRPIMSFCPEKTILVGSVSKTIAPGLRIGWMAVPKKLLPALILQKKSSQIFTEVLPQLVVGEFWRRGLYESQLKKVRNYYREKRNVVLAALKEFFPKQFTWTKPGGGFFIWVTTPEKLDASRLLTKALQGGVSYLPGFLFYHKAGGFNSFRLSYSEVRKDQIRTGIRSLSEVMTGQESKNRPAKLSFQSDRKGSLFRFLWKTNRR